MEATCPLVHAAHRAVARLVREGFHPVIIGKRDHVEVRGMTGDLDAFDVVLDEEDVAKLCERPRFGVVAQTTQPIDRVRQLVRLIRERFPQSEVCFIDTVCQPTKQRQNAAIELAQSATWSSSSAARTATTRSELVKTCSRFCARVHHVQTADDLQAEWFVNTETIGITAGTSTPDKTVCAVETRLKEFAGNIHPSHHESAQPREEHEHSAAVRFA